MASAPSLGKVYIIFIYTRKYTKLYEAALVLAVTSLAALLLGSLLKVEA
ncbi:hypothetical protein FOXB_05492 [Fusarium oxysporum f. sp. conglutinans Fo5176]|uniref:Uncharacterized protein n=1 Tax=Fusarium oxysporum (strain Fo5176) TaxID=660025 RepID=F9FGG3_FUSOF|nr:hypothetical protein FOXB_05492 [Fusarium oxysporum f. sp. conglutinans Fo5176]